jgi:hypothetical protein
MTLKEILEILGNPGVTFALGGVCGFLATRLTMTASERAQRRQQIYDNGVKHKQDREKRYLDFTNAMRSYVSKPESPTLDDFHSVSTTGDLYFGELMIIADAILAGNVDNGSRDNNFVPAIVEALQKNIPLYYETLGKIASKLGVSYEGRFKRSNYESLFTVAERFASNAALPPIGNSTTARGL